MKALLLAIFTALLTGIQQLCSNPWKVLLFIVAVLIVRDLLTPDRASIITAIIGYLDAAAKKITLQLIALVAIVLALKK